jgi:hypothetical protein
MSHVGLITEYATAIDMQICGRKKTIQDTNQRCADVTQEHSAQPHSTQQLPWIRYGTLFCQRRFKKAKFFVSEYFGWWESASVHTDCKAKLAEICRRVCDGLRSELHGALIWSGFDATLTDVVYPMNIGTFSMREGTLRQIF